MNRTRSPDISLHTLLTLTTPFTYTSYTYFLIKSRTVIPEGIIGSTCS